MSSQHRRPSAPGPRPIVPNSTIGILGGGQLGRMTASAARAMGYGVRVLDPDEHAPAFALADEAIVAPFDDAAAAARLAERCDVVTLEIEQVAPAMLEAASKHAPVRPGVSAVHITQDRGREKEFLAANGFPTGPFAVVESSDACVAAVQKLGASIVKATMGGYDGRGQVRVKDASAAADAFAQVGGTRAVVEQFLDIEAELSVLVARSASGEVVAYPPSRNHHEHGILVWAVVPADFGERIERDARDLAIAITEALDIVGLLAIEMFLLKDGRLLVNELAPRPHNTYHHTERACPTSQFEQLVRAVCGLPLGDVSIVRPAAIHNLLGDLWADGEPEFVNAFAMPGVRVHLYGKRVAKPGRKMGHLSACGESGHAALRLVRAAFGCLRTDNGLLAGHEPNRLDQFGQA